MVAKKPTGGAQRAPPHPLPPGAVRVKPSFNGCNNRSKMVLHVPLNLLLKLFTYYYYYFLKKTSRGDLNENENLLIVSHIYSDQYINTFLH